jgi:ribosomal protein S12 methylthiotransferase accessory factor
VLQEVDTNGLASGNTLLEAVLHGLCEVVERDMLGQLEFCSLFGAHDRPAPEVRDLDPATLPPETREWTTKLAAAGLHCRHQDITSDIGVATIRTVLLDPAYSTDSGPTAVRFVGCGTAPDARVALLRSVTEAVQSRLSFVQSARDSFNSKPLGMRAAARDAYRREMSATRPVPFTAVPSFESDDLLTDLRFVLQQLKAAGFDQAVAVDLTRPDLEVPVVRVRVPGLSSFYVNRRRPGWRCLRHLL